MTSKLPLPSATKAPERSASPAIRTLAAIAERSSLVAAMCALLAGRYVTAVPAPVTRRFFQLNPLDARMIANAVIASAIAVRALARSGSRHAREAQHPSRPRLVADTTSEGRGAATTVRIRETSTMILIAYDGSEHAIAAVKAAGRLMSGQPALVLTVWEPFTMILSRTPASMGSIGGYGDISHIDAASRAGAQRQAAEGARLAREHGLHATGGTVARVGSIAEAILSESDRSEADAIVVGTRGLGAVGSLLLGGVSHAIVQHAGQPVMVVPAPSLAARRTDAQSERGSQ